MVDIPTSLLAHSLQTATAEALVEELYDYVQQLKLEHKQEIHDHGDGNACHCWDDLLKAEKKLIEFCDVLELEYPDGYEDCPEDEED